MQATKGFSKESFSFRLSYISLLKSSTWNKIYDFYANVKKSKDFDSTLQIRKTSSSFGICIFSNRKFYIYTRRTLDVDETWHIGQIASLSNMEELLQRMNVWFDDKQMIFTEQILGSASSHIHTY